MTRTFLLSDEDIERIAKRLAEKIKKAFNADAAKAIQAVMTTADNRLQLSRVEAAKWLGCSVPTIDRLVKRGLLHPNRATRRPMFAMKELERFITECSRGIEC
jgi:ribosomal protein S20